VGDDVLQRTVCNIETLPTLPHIYAALTRVLADPDASLADIAEILEQDVALCAKILQLVNSAFFGSPRQVAGIQNAITYLGTNMIKNLALSVEVFRTFEGCEKLPGFSFETQQRHALIAASIARRLVTEKQHAEDAFTAAILHDIGKLILATRLQEQFARVLAVAGEEGSPTHVVEKRLTGVTHAEIGGYLLGIWGLPYPMVEAVAHHHAPAGVSHKSFDVLDAVYVADLLAHEYTPPSHESPREAKEELDIAYLKALGVEGDLPAWRAIAAEQAEISAKGLEHECQRPCSHPVCRR